MSNFVLVHGGWHGGWCWRQVADKLTSAGHRVLTPTLTGLGERSHLIAAVQSPDTHVQDICNVIKWNELHDVVLVGHSYGGMVITGVASAMPARIARLVYVDAFVPTQSGMATNRMASPERAAEIAAARQADGSVLPTGFERWSDDPDTVTWLRKMCTPHPGACFGKGVTLTGNENQVTDRVFILAARHRPSPFWQFYERYHDDPLWQVHQVDCLHDVMLDAPDELVALLTQPEPKD